MFKKSLLLASICTSLALPAIASDLSYTYIGVSYETGEVADLDFDGFGIQGSVALNDSFFLLGDYTSLGSDDEFDIGFGSDDIDAEQIRICGAAEPPHIPLLNKPQCLHSL
ncbi:MAG: hypothetical protein GYB33_12445 [Gammaproteobacteria bacterium]|nr:hypothetical protein [Gammaproteobacteria bacterium]